MLDTFVQLLPELGVAEKMVGRIKNGQWVRQADPPVKSKTNGYRCTDQYYTPPNTPY